MATVGDTYDASAPKDYTLSPLLSSASAISSISDIRSVSEPASALDTTGKDLQHERSSLGMSSKAHLDLRPHSRYYFQGGMIDIAVKDTVFRIPRSIFTYNSAPFTELIQAHDYLETPEYNSSTLFMEEEDVTPADFERLLEVLYPLKFGEVSITTLEEWTSVLHLASKWSFHTIRALAINHLVTLASPIDKVVLGRKYDIQEWLLDAYVSLCERSEPLTLEEALRMSIEDVVKISEGRHRVRVYSGLVSPGDLKETVCNLFDVSQANKKEPEPVSHTPENPPKPSSSQSKPVDPITPPVVREETILQPLDLVRVTRLVKAVGEQNSTIAQTGLRSILLPYHAQPDAMDAVLKIISNQAIDKGTSFFDALSDIAVFLSNIIDPGCTDGSSTGPSGESLTGRAWLMDRLIAHCDTMVDGWNIFTSIGETWANVHGVTKLLVALVDAGLISDNVFIPLWEGISRMSERPVTEWAKNMDGYLADNYIRKTQIASCFLLIDDFYHRVQVCKLEYEGKKLDQIYNHSSGRWYYPEEYYILEALKKIAASRM